jgi:ABC-2 type transport system permease protein
VNSQSNVMPESSLRSQRIAAESIPPARLMYWSVRRELWEIRAIYITPVAVACLFLIGFSISILHLLVKMHAAPGLDVMQQRELFGQPYEFAEDLIMGTLLLVGLFYSADALYGERRDRSILFWKSAPVSDLTTVLSKAAIPMVILPLLAFAITVLTQWIMLMMSSAVLLGSGQNVATLWSRVGIFHRWPMLLFHFLCIHGLWQSPIYAWLLLVSGWARRVPILWATLPPLTIGIVEKVAFNTTYFGSMIGNRFTGGSEGTAIMKDSRAMDPMMLFAPLHFLINPGLWIGLAVTAAFLAAAVRIRRCRGPI